MDGDFSVFIILFFNWSMKIYSKYKPFHLQQTLYVVCSFVTIFKSSNFQSHYTFFNCIKLYQILSLFSTINLAYVLEFKIFGRGYSNLNNLFQRYSFPAHIQDLLQRIRTTSAAKKRERAFWHYILQTLPKTSFGPQGTFSIKLMGLQFKSQIKLEHRIVSQY